MCEQDIFVRASCGVGTNLDRCDCCACEDIFTNDDDILDCANKFIFNFSSSLRDRIYYQLFNSANESIVYYDKLNREENNYIETVCISSTECYRLDSKSYPDSSLSEVTLSVSFNNDMINDTLPGVSNTAFGYSAVDQAIRQDVCDSFTICGMNLQDGSYQRMALNMITEFASLTDFEDKSSPQHQALCWLLKEITGPVDSSIIQRYVLAVMFYSIDGDGWINNAHWTSGEDHCNWYGISCNKGVVDQLNLVANNLMGALPTEIGELTGLEHINLSFNELVGPFPLDIVKLKNLKQLNLSNNKFQGSIPSEIKHLKIMKELILSFNELTGALPSEIGNLAEIEILDLSHNSFSGAAFDAIQNLTTLKELNLSNNLFRGEVEKLITLGELGK